MLRDGTMGTQRVLFYPREDYYDMNRKKLESEDETGNMKTTYAFNGTKPLPIVNEEGEAIDRTTVNNAWWKRHDDAFENNDPWEGEFQPFGTL